MNRSEYLEKMRRQNKIYRKFTCDCCGYDGYAITSRLISPNTICPKCGVLQSVGRDVEFEKYSIDDIDAALGTTTNLGTYMPEYICVKDGDDEKAKNAMTIWGLPPLKITRIDDCLDDTMPIYCGAIPHPCVHGQQITLENGMIIASIHERDCCEGHWLAFDECRDELVGKSIDLSKPWFERVDGSGIRLFVDGEWPVFVPGYGYNNGYYSSDINLVVIDKEHANELMLIDVSKCQDWNE